MAPTGRTAGGATGTGSANRVARAQLLLEPPSIDKGEVTDKGSINQRAVLANRATLIEDLYQTGMAKPFVYLPNLPNQAARTT